MAYIGQTPTAVPLDGDDLANDIITLAKMASGTDGNIISYDASGNPVAIATGSDGQVLTSGGAGAAPSFAAGGKVVQVVNVMDGAVATGTTTVPLDDTIPQITEGDEYMTLAITPTSATNKLLIQVFTVSTTAAAAGRHCVALFQDAIADALACSYTYRPNSSGEERVDFAHYMTSGTVSAITFRVRIGDQSAGTTTFNGFTAARKYGGALASSITITEIAV